VRDFGVIKHRAQGRDVDNWQARYPVKDSINLPEDPLFIHIFADAKVAHSAATRC